MITEIKTKLNIEDTNTVLTEQELSAIYYYLSYVWEDLASDDKQFWIEMINKFDPW